MPTDGQQNRVFLRIPVKILADVYLDGRFYKKVRLVDLSTHGLAFFTDASGLLPNDLEIRFRLSLFSGTIRIAAGVKNRVALPKGVRVGCIFLQISDPDKKRIDQYVCNFSGISFPENAVHVAAFLCALDASIRSLLYYLASYYGATEFGRRLLEPVLSGHSGVMLALYVASAFFAFILSSPAVLRKGKLSFISSLLLLAYAFFFLCVKNFTAWRNGLWGFNDWDMNTVLTAQLLFAIYLGFALMTGLIFLKKVTLVLDIIKQEFSVLRLGFVQLNFLRKRR